MWSSLKKCVTPSRTGARSDADATAAWSYGGAGELDEHNTPNGDHVSRVHGVDTFTAHGVCNGGG